jgi:hypothetical protein
VTGCAFVFGDEFFTQFVVDILEDGGLGMGQIASKKAKPCQDTHAENFHSHFPIKKAAQGQALERQKSHEYPSNFLNHAM